MKVSTTIKIKSNPYLQRYIRENSYWYKLLNRNPELINQMSEDMKKAYINPEMEIVEIKGQVLLAGSLPLSETEVNSGEVLAPEFEDTSVLFDE